MFGEGGTSRYLAISRACHPPKQAFLNDIFFMSLSAPIWDPPCAFQPRLTKRWFCQSRQALLVILFSLSTALSRHRLVSARIPPPKHRTLFCRVLFPGVKGLQGKTFPTTHEHDERPFFRAEPSPKCQAFHLVCLSVLWEKRRSSPDVALWPVQPAAGLSPILNANMPEYIHKPCGCDQRRFPSLAQTF